jgi:hypothetical protein
MEYNLLRHGWPGMARIVSHSWSSGVVKVTFEFTTPEGPVKTSANCAPSALSRLPDYTSGCEVA